MCENTRHECGNCTTPVTELTYVERRTEVVTYPLDEDGDANWDYPESEYEDGEGGHIECPSCGWTGSASSLDHDREPEDCECDECNPAEPGDEPEEWQMNDIVMLVRTEDTYQGACEDSSAPPEFRQLMTDRTICVLPMPRWRAHELWEECLSKGLYPSLELDYTTPPPDTSMNLMHDYERKEEVTA